MPNDTKPAAPRLQCPACHCPLSAADGPIVCAHCAHVWTWEAGVHDLAFPPAEPEKGFPTEVHADVFEREEALHYLSWYRATLLEQLILSRFSRQDALHALDAGCGTGFVAGWLGRRLPNSRFTLADLAPEPLQFARKRGAGPCYRAVNENLPFPDGEFDLVLSLDVYEHLDRDDAAIAEAFRVLKPGGVHIVFAPGMRVLWNVGDEIQCHRRRYERADLRRLMEQAGFEVARLSATLVTPLPLALAARIGRRKLLSEERARETALSDFWTPPAVLNQCIKWALLPELWTLRHWNHPWGISLAAVGVKPVSGAQ